MQSVPSTETPPAQGEPAVLAQLQHNRLLGAFAPADRKLLLRHAEIVELATGTVLVESGDDVVHTYFPTSGAMAALILVMRDGSIAEAATIGKEGAIGGIVSAGHKPAFARAMVQLPGPCLRIETSRLEEAKRASPHLHDLFARYADALLAQVLQSVVCNALHSLDQRCCRWLLTTRDRVGGDALDVTQEFISHMLGVQRTTVTRTLGDLARRGLIEQARGRITILDPRKLEKASCECYRSVRDHFARILPEMAERPPGSTPF
ncbi:Crp/Fnr family transcriptional regulator [Geminicoccus roseus]|uniref:Crp/Fnr family transcriptional regulator n=1 Tax=Geminicoccus roseus TaxID=404900 RepID=UPI00041337A5|nr:Crp/Fnr family transcriptional regulator [Geminicoccus roseus]